MVPTKSTGFALSSSRFIVAHDRLPLAEDCMEFSERATTSMQYMSNVVSDFYVSIAISLLVMPSRSEDTDKSFWYALRLFLSVGF